MDNSMENEKISFRERLRKNAESLKIRIKSEEPSFFKKILKFSLIFSGIAASLLGLFPTLTIEPPAWLVKALEYLIVAGTVAAGLSKLTSINDLGESSIGEDPDQ